MSIAPEDIVDATLRDQLTQLNLTIPHEQSVLDPILDEYDRGFYQKLLAMEAYTYERSERPAELINGAESGQAGVEQYAPYWEEYNASLVGYVTHAPLPKQTVKDVITGLFCFLSVHSQRGVGNPSTITRSNAREIFRLNGHIDTVLGYEINHYDDLIPEDTMAIPPTAGSAEMLEGEPEAVDAAWTADAAVVQGLLDEYADAVSDVSMNVMFSGEPPQQKGLSRLEMWDTIFEQLNWLWFINHFNSNVTVPKRPK